MTSHIKRKDKNYFLRLGDMVNQVGIATCYGVILPTGKIAVITRFIKGASSYSHYFLWGVLPEEIEGEPWVPEIDRNGTLLNHQTLSSSISNKDLDFLKKHPFWCDFEIPHIEDK